MRFHLVAVATVVVLATACGGGGSSSPEQEVKDVTADFLEAMIDGRNGEACALTTNVDECLRALVLARRFLGEGGMEELIGDDWQEKVDSAEVTFADDNHATFPPLWQDKPTELVREDGEWLLLFEE
jgi:hypothetical protein